MFGLKKPKKTSKPSATASAFAAAAAGAGADDEQHDEHDYSNDLSRDGIQCLFRSHDDLIESLYQVAAPAVYDIIRTMWKEVSKLTDSPENLKALFEDGLSKTPDWNRLTVREVTRSWAKLSREMIMLVRKICTIKAKIMQKNDLIRDANSVTVTLEFCSILHSVIVFSSVAFIEELDELLASNGSQASTEIIMRRHQAVERAVVHLTRDALNEQMFEDSCRSSNNNSNSSSNVDKAAGTFPTVYVSNPNPSCMYSAPPPASASQSVDVLRYSAVPCIEAAKPEPVKQDEQQQPERKASYDLADAYDDVDALDQDFPPAFEDEVKTDSPVVVKVCDPMPDITGKVHEAKPINLTYNPLPLQNQSSSRKKTFRMEEISRDMARVLLKEM